MVIAKLLTGFGKQYLFFFTETGLLVAQGIPLIQKRIVFFITLEINSDNRGLSIWTQ